MKQIKTNILIHRQWLIGIFLLVCLARTVESAEVTVSTTEELVDAVNSGVEGDIINITPGTYMLTSSQQLKPKADMTIKGAGMDSTIIKADASWNPGTSGLPDGAVEPGSGNRSAYLFDLAGNNYITISDMTLDGIDQLHGAIYAAWADYLEFSYLHIVRYIWSGIRTWEMDESAIYECIFEDAGGEHRGVVGGGLYLTWVKTSEIYNNRFIRSTGSTRPFMGIKGREIRYSRIHHNTMFRTDTKHGFCIEFPFENDYDAEIDHNYLSGAISIPKGGGGGNLPASGVTFRIHHNYFDPNPSYALEWNRRGAYVHNNLFDFKTEKDGGNLISSWSDNSDGPTFFHDNHIKNPGRGIFWAENVYNNFNFYNNHVIANKTVTPRKEGLFGFNPSTDFSTMAITDNIIQCYDQDRPLFRNSESCGTKVENNTLEGVSGDAAGCYDNPDTGETRGPLTSMQFYVGVHDEYYVNNWTVTGGSVGVAEKPTVPQEFALLSNYPNPFNPSTTISYSLDRTEQIELTVYTMLGTKISTLFSGVQTAGRHEIQWNGMDENGRQASSGLYIYMLKTSTRTDYDKMTLLK